MPSRAERHSSAKQNGNGARHNGNGARRETNGDGQRRKTRGSRRNPDSASSQSSRTRSLLSDEESYSSYSSYSRTSASYSSSYTSSYADRAAPRGRRKSQSNTPSRSAASSRTSSISGRDDDDDDDDDVEGEFEQQDLHTAKEFEMTSNHSKLLVLISKYGQCALTADDLETWIRETPLMVMIYEGISAGEFEYDYSPKSVLLSFEGASRRMFLNISQEGKNALDDLREQRLINAMKMISEDQQPISCYQTRRWSRPEIVCVIKVSLKGLQVLKTLPNSLFEHVNQFVYAPNAPHYDTELLECHFDGDKFVLKSRAGYQRSSKVTETEDLSYVSSPMLPESLRSSGAREMSSNAHRAHEAATGASNVKDEMSEAIQLSFVTCLVAEWVPFGTNNIVALNERLGALDRCKGGLFTSFVDTAPTETQFSPPADMTSVSIIDFDIIGFINFETEIKYAEEYGIVQVESFGMHMRMDGVVINGMRIEAIMDRLADNVSFDMLSRVLVDVQLDSSKIMDDLLSSYQRSLLNMIFLGDALNRSKFCVILAEGMQPRLPAKHYVDGAEYELELKQVLGTIFISDDIGPEHMLMVGQEGLFLVGPNPHRLEAYLLHYVDAQCRQAFIRSFFFRTFVLVDTLKKIRHLIIQVDSDPENVNRIRMALSEASRDLILLQEAHGYLRESLTHMQAPPKPAREDATARRLYKVLHISSLVSETQVRLNDLEKLIDGAANQLENLQQTTDVINTKQLEDAYTNVEQNTKFLVAATAATERSSSSLAIMQVVLAGGFAFDLLDRSTGGTLNIDPSDWAVRYVFAGLIDPIGVWFTVNIVFLFFLCYALVRLMRYLVGEALGVLTLRVKLNKKIRSEDGLHSFLGTKILELTDLNVDQISSTKNIMWVEDDADKWLGAAPTIELTYDDRYQFLLYVTFTVDRKKSSAKERVQAEALDRLEAFGAEAEEGAIEAALARTKVRVASTSRVGAVSRLFGRKDHKKLLDAD